MKRSELLNIGFTITLGFAALSGGDSIQSLKKGSSSGSGLDGQSCSIPADCPEQAPYCNVVYPDDGSTNYGVCGVKRVPPPLQVIDINDCPPGTKGRLIYPNEGSEAVCLTSVAP